MTAPPASPRALLRTDLGMLEPYRVPDAPATMTRLNANESPWPPAGDASTPGLNRYPTPYAHDLEARLAQLWGVPAAQVVVARGGDECIDLIVRATLAPGHGIAVTCPPTFAMYAISARIHGALVREVPLSGPNFDIDVAGIDDAVGRGARLVFLCSPNNPTGGSVPLGTIEALATRLAGRALVAIDEAYADFSPLPSALSLLDRRGNVVVLRTLSKAHALAGARIGALVAHPDVVDAVRRLLPPFAISAPSLEAAKLALADEGLAETRARIKQILAERERLAARLSRLPTLVEVQPSEANFLLVRSADPAALVAAATRAGILLRDFSSSPLTEGCVRITVGAPAENDALVDALATLTT